MLSGSNAAPTLMPGVEPHRPGHRAATLATLAIAPVPAKLRGRRFSTSASPGAGEPDFRHARLHP